ncbi:phospholipase D-like domain-containing protein [Sphingomonas solaris]|uniref:Phospholipase D n=1 Tax=Alterirhizorhabdus solaris TaxID=2529389 RepID=A0A558R8P2_9SPHN|nr:phospholipase D-like domain-containing protein [Sphingomonas solaris]TVV75744.1 phospholipase [Sphingomonas solaris]
MDDNGTLLKPGQNCWRVERASRVAVIIDADDYFKAARAAMMKAKKQIVLVGWDFDARIRFGGDVDDGGPERVGGFFSWLVRRTPGLQVHILRWDTGAIKTLFHGQTLLRLVRWMRDPQIHLRLDGHHPPAGSHHQKVVVIDDDVAFCGGIDMTVDRWDTRDHLDENPRRREPDGTLYGPWHDATTMLEGPVAKSLGEMCRRRWGVSGGIPMEAVTAGAECWPDGVEPDFTDVDVGIALTVPEMANQEPRHEIEALYVDLVARTKRHFYAESQYFASRRVAEAIGKRLAEPDGPEFVIVHPTTAEGWLEPIAMDSARARLVEALKEQDPHGRLRLYHPFTAGGAPIYVHAKVTVIDDEVLRVGSSNFNNRSLRLDTECDVVIDASRERNADERTTIAGIRNSLLAEHLDTTPEKIEAAIAETGSIIATIERFQSDGRSLRPYEVPELDAVRAWLADNKILDPEGPGEMFEGLSARKPLLGSLRPHLHRPDGSISATSVSLMALGIAGVAAGAVALARYRRTER